MILVDTSLWIDLLNTRRAYVSHEDLLRFVTCGPVLQEVLQGLREAPQTEALRQAISALPRVGDPVPVATYLHAAEICRSGRRRGYSIRSIDCLIAAIAIENGLPVWHRDRDFTAISRFTELTTLAKLPRR